MISGIIITRSSAHELGEARRVAENLLACGADEAVIQTGGGGIAHAKNLGASHARGEVLLFVDNDVHLRGSLAPLSNPPASEQFWLPRAFRGRAGGFYSTLGCLFINWVYRNDLWPFGIGPFQAIRSEVFREIGGFRPEVSFEDLNLDLRLWQASRAWGHLPVEVDVLRPFTLPFKGVPRTTGRGKALPSDATAYVLSRSPSGLGLQVLRPDLEGPEEVRHRSIVTRETSMWRPPSAT